MCYGWGGGLRPTLGVPLLVPIAGCHCTGTAKFGGVVPLLPLLCAVVGGEEDDQLWGSGAIAGCHCSWAEGRVTTNFGGVDVVPLLGAHTQQWHPDKLP